jgi:hypothetical protein
MVPQIVCKKVTLIFSFSDEKVAVMSRAQLILKPRGAVKEKPGGIVVVEGHLMSKVDGEDAEGDGVGLPFENGVKVTVLVMELMDFCERYVDKSVCMRLYDVEWVVHNGASVSSKSIGVLELVDALTGIVYSLLLATSLIWVG